MSRHHVEAALRHMRRISDMLKQLDQRTLTDLDRKSRFRATSDGFPTATIGDGTSRGTNPLTSVESATEARIWGNEPNDEVGDAIRDVFVWLTEMAERAHKINHSLEYIEHVRTKTEGRQMSTAGACQACDREVAGTEADRMRSGYCEACYRAWTRAGRPERAGWEFSRRRDETAPPEQTEKAS